MATSMYFAIFFILVTVLECLGSRVVDTGAGSFQGTVASDGDYYQFFGIPYGQVDPDNPFGVASPYPAASGLYDANNDSYACPQMDLTGAIIGSLDCLRLNVYVPTAATNTSQLPVMVYIHGGSFEFGRPNKDHYGPRLLIRHGVILVTIAYRLGPYGFMCLNRRRVPGNQGLKDQFLALQWVRDNIGAFGGNPDQVTIFGQSAGAHSIDLHLLSQRDLLYSNVIIQSGSSLAQTMLYEPDREAPIRLASHLGLEHSNVSEALRSLSNAPTSDVIKASSQLNILFKPCAETNFTEVEPFITDYWINSTVSKAARLPIMIGFTEYEALIWHINESPGHFQNTRDLINTSLTRMFDFAEAKGNMMVGVMKKFYFGDNENLTQEVTRQVINFESDYLYNHPIQRSIRKFVDAGAKNVFYYMFSYSGGRNAASATNLDIQGATHADDLRYLFDMASLPAPISAEDQLVIDAMTTMWTNFAKYSDPTPSSTRLLPVKWNPLTSSIYHYLNIGSELSMLRRPIHKRMAFWDLFLKVNGVDQRNFNAAVAAEDDDDIDGGGGGGSTTVNSSFLTIVLTLSFVAYHRF